jgi:TatD DNase family protein
MMDDIKLFDSHCHLDMEEFAGEVEDVLSRSRDAGLRRLLLAACDEASSLAVLALRERYGDFGVELWASAGVHPHEAGSVRHDLPASLIGLASRESVAAVGEIGLDYYYDNSPREAQKAVFESQLEWAVRVQKPVLVHLRNAKERSGGDAYCEALSIMKNFSPRLAGVIHCFSGDISDARAALDMGFYISFAGPLTYPKSDELRRAAAFIPDDRILCETDSPYLAPQGWRGKRNEPALVREVYLTMARLRGVGVEELAEVVWENGERLFAQTMRA